MQSGRLGVVFGHFQWAVLRAARESRHPRVFVSVWLERVLALEDLSLSPSSSSLLELVRSSPSRAGMAHNSSSVIVAAAVAVLARERGFGPPRDWQRQPGGELLRSSPLIFVAGRRIEDAHRERTREGRARETQLETRGRAQLQQHRRNITVHNCASAQHQQQHPSHCPPHGTAPLCRRRQPPIGVVVLVVVVGGQLALLQCSLLQCSWSHSDCAIGHECCPASLVCQARYRNRTQQETPITLDTLHQINTTPSALTHIYLGFIYLQLLNFINRLRGVLCRVSPQ